MASEASINTDRILRGLGAVVLVLFGFTLNYFKEWNQEQDKKIAEIYPLIQQVQSTQQQVLLTQQQIQSVQNVIQVSNERESSERSNLAIAITRLQTQMEYESKLRQKQEEQINASRNSSLPN